MASPMQVPRLRLQEAAESHQGEPWRGGRAAWLHKLQSGTPQKHRSRALQSAKQCHAEDTQVVPPVLENVSLQPPFGHVHGTRGAIAFRELF